MAKVLGKGQGARGRRFENVFLVRFFGELTKFLAFANHGTETGQGLDRRSPWDCPRTRQ